MTNPKVTPLFASPLYTDHISLDQSWIDYLWQVPWERTLANNGYLSLNKDILDQDDLTDLKQNIMVRVQEYVSILGISNLINWSITKSWAVKHLENDSAGSHYHTNSIFSGILFLHVPPNSGILRLRRNPMIPSVTTSTITLDTVEDNDTNMSNMERWDVYCKPGKLILFPSHLYHSVTKNVSGQERLTLAFNLWPKGRLGNMGLDEIYFG